MPLSLSKRDQQLLSVLVIWPLDSTKFKMKVIVSFERYTSPILRNASAMSSTRARSSSFLVEPKVPYLLGTWSCSSRKIISYNLVIQTISQIKILWFRQQVVVEKSKRLPKTNRRKSTSPIELNTLHGLSMTSFSVSLIYLTSISWPLESTMVRFTCGIWGRNK